MTRKWGLVCLAAIATAGGAAVSPESAGELNVCHAGSLQAAFSTVEQELTKQRPGLALRDVSGGSVALAGRMAAGLQPCDVYAAADYLDIDLLLKPAGLADSTIVFAKGRWTDTGPQLQLPVHLRAQRGRGSQQRFYISISRLA